MTVSSDREPDLGLAMQQAAERHMALVWEAHYAQEDADDPSIEIPTPAVGPFCGCETCVVREILAGAWPVIEAYFALRTPNIALHPKGGQ